jgi:hypothetical protein
VIAVRAPVERPAVLEDARLEACAAVGRVEATINVTTMTLTKKPNVWVSYRSMLLLVLGDLLRVASAWYPRGCLKRGQV